ncbi:sodium/potassium/calcium exchanger 3 [Chrysoperla carnea]|uniref:sodium/potassium/calcium exchanger 3 n=1 Tax=Chrysoperla carnea TaxID=189513 RepID=UPI001D080508|nr:sodium/potassium/calcium exchanger 3 [Chrysoperla carnea]
MGVSIKSKRTRIALILRLVLITGILGTYVIISLVSQQFSSNDRRSELQGEPSLNQRHLLTIEDELGINCTPPAIDEFPNDGFTRTQRKQGYVLIHFIASCYFFVLLAIVCDDYFVPAIKMMCNSLRMAEDVAGATFMAAASSSPELFINCVGTFITQGDLGVGTIVGSAVFNVLAVPACCGLFSRQTIQLDWWPVSRDCLMYGLSVIFLILVLDDGRIDSMEAFCLVAAYLFYISTMYFNEEISNGVKKFVRYFRKRSTYRDVTEIRPLLKTDKNVIQHNGSTLGVPVIGQPENGSNEMGVQYQEMENLEESTEIWKWPDQDVSSCGKLFWIITWPISFVLYCTIPNIHKRPKLVIVSFFMCILWIGATSYCTAWFITVIGDTLEIPDSVMGLTFLAAGTSVPEAVSSVIVTNQGHGAMGVSNSLGSNTFDILLCLGLPWLIKSAFYPVHEGQHFIQINSSGLTYSAVSLFSSLVLLYLAFIFNKFVLDWKIGLTCLLMYIAFLVFSSIIELNIFFRVNLPTCDR